MQFDSGDTAVAAIHMNQMKSGFQIRGRYNGPTLIRRSERKQNVFTNKDALGESYKPKHTEGRDNKISECMDALQPVVDGWRPNNIFLYGNTGVGKTAVTEFLLETPLGDVSQRDSMDLGVTSVNRRTLNSSYQMAVELVNELRPFGAMISSTGHPQQTAFKRLFQELNDVGGTVLIVLDEVNSIGDRDELLYELPRTCSNSKLEDAKVGLTGISSDFRLHDQPDPRMQDTLCEHKLHFPSYRAPELQNILELRAGVAIAEDTCEESMSNLCAALAARDGGSTWQALDLLRPASEHVENKDDERITLDHVDTTRQRPEQERVVERIRGPIENGHFALLAVVSKAAHDEMPCRIHNLYQEYLRLYNSAGIDPLVQRSVHNHLSDPRMLDVLLAEENRTDSHGNCYGYVLGTPFPDAMEALSDVFALDSVLGEIRKAAAQAEAA